MRLLLLAITLLLLPATIGAAIRHVNPEGTGEYPTIAAALAAAAAGDTVELACGTYYENDLELPDGLLLRGEGGLASCATIDGQLLSRVIHSGQDVRLRGLTIQRGYYHGEYGYGAGARLSGEVFVENSDFLENYLQTDEIPYDGGGLAVNGDATLVNCRFEDNQAGGADGARISGSLVMSACTLQGDDVEVYGATWETATIAGCTFGYGADVVTNQVHTTVSQSVFEPGSGLACYSQDSVHLFRVTFAEGEICLDDGMGLFMDRCLVSASESWPDTWCGEDPIAVLLTCNDFHGDDFPAIISEQIGQSGNISADPLFCDDAAGDFTLDAASPCLPENNDCGLLMGAYGQGCDLYTAAGETLPSAFALAQNHPNPFNPSTEIAFTLPESDAVTLRIFDPSGRLVRVVLANVPYAAGVHHARWNGLDEMGVSASSGVYFYRIDADDFSETRKMTLLK